MDPSAFKLDFILKDSPSIVQDGSTLLTKRKREEDGNIVVKKIPSDTQESSDQTSVSVFDQYNIHSFNASIDKIKEISNSLTLGLLREDRKVYREIYSNCKQMIKSYQLLNQHGVSIPQEIFIINFVALRSKLIDKPRKQKQVIEHAQKSYECVPISQEYAKVHDIYLIFRLSLGDEVTNKEFFDLFKHLDEANIRLPGTVRHIFSIKSDLLNRVEKNERTMRRHWAQEFDLLLKQFQQMTDEEKKTTYPTFQNAMDQAYSFLISAKDDKAIENLCDTMRGCYYKISERHFLDAFNLLFKSDFKKGIDFLNKISENCDFYVESYNLVSNSIINYLENIAKNDFPSNEWEKVLGTCQKLRHQSHKLIYMISEEAVKHVQNKISSNDKQMQFNKDLENNSALCADIESTEKSIKECNEKSKKYRNELDTKNKDLERVSLDKLLENKKIQQGIIEIAEKEVRDFPENLDKKIKYNTACSVLINMDLIINSYNADIFKRDAYIEKSILNDKLLEVYHSKWNELTNKQEQYSELFKREHDRINQENEELTRLKQEFETILHFYK